VEWVAHHIRALVLFLFVSLVLTTLLLTCYPFYPQSLVRLGFFFLLAATIGAILTVNSQMNRDPLLSRIAGTAPGKLTWNASFVTNLLTFGVIPLLTILSSEFPGLREFLFSWAKPVSDLLTQH
ncbi:MAG TPA: hypothetical protein VNH46_00210, partial [Gemmatimonadales bacterium]|nr:hypothetical protein [Gemmatimonadales bacterium]